MPHDNIVLTSLVHHLVSSTNEFVAGFDKLLEQPQESFQIPRGSLEALRTLIGMNASFTSKLFEENQRIMPHDNIVLTSLVHHLVSSTNEFVAGFDKLLEQPQESFQIPRGSLEALRTLIGMNASFTSKLFEENQRIMDVI